MQIYIIAMEHVDMYIYLETIQLSQIPGNENLKMNSKCKIIGMRNC